MRQELKAGENDVELTYHSTRHEISNLVFLSPETPSRTEHCPG